MGNGEAPIDAKPQDTVHPHAYGERESRWQIIVTNHGSSPRIWGTVFPGLLQRQCQRFIPTHMGNGEWLLEVSAARAVHPHAYGERRLDIKKPTFTVGSSPRIWGTVHRQRALK